MAHGLPVRRRMARDHRKLRVFVRADALALRVYHATRTLPPEERDGLQSQMWRAAVSVASNIVEGCVRRSDKENGRFIDIVLGSAAETHYLLSVARRLHLLPAKVVSSWRMSANSCCEA